MENNQYPTKEYVGQIKNLIKEYKKDGNIELLGYWEHELYILTGRRETTNENYNTWNWMVNILI